MRTVPATPCDCIPLRACEGVVVQASAVAVTQQADTGRLVTEQSGDGASDPLREPARGVSIAVAIYKNVGPRPSRKRVFEHAHELIRQFLINSMPMSGVL